MRILSAVFFFYVFAFPAAMAEEPKGRILIVVSSLVDMGDPEQHDARNNLLEVAPPYHVFLMHGYAVDFVSPNGGEAHFMMDPLGISSYAIKYEGFLDKTSKTLKPSDINPKDYQAVFIGGGYGPMFDVADHAGILEIMRAIYEAGGVIGGCGHGPGSFANVKLMSGEYMVEGKRVAGFPNSTEEVKPWAKNGTLLPFLVENRLRERGAIALNKETLPDKTEVVIDERIVSTMFLPSAALVAKEMVDLLERLPHAAPLAGD